MGDQLTLAKARGNEGAKAVVVPERQRESFLQWGKDRRIDPPGGGGHASSLLRPLRIVKSAPSSRAEPRLLPLTARAATSPPGCHAEARPGAAFDAGYQVACAC